MTLAEFVGAETEPLHGTRTEILHQHVRLRDEFRQDLAACHALDVDGERTFPAIGRDEQGRELPALVDRSAATAGDIAPTRPGFWDRGAPVRSETGRLRGPPHPPPMQGGNTTMWARATTPPFF